MRRRLDGIEAELSAAVARVAHLYEAVPEHLRPDLAGERWHELERQIDQAAGANDRDAALRAINDWQEHAERVLSAALLNAPLTREGGRR